ncbi:hypothetical protein CLIB1444_10S01508 [[Candida] jaroonii]|uniref:Uncharacterized protein n=1 Tax=[Candida] jaroonii TaxID=467808 RepID=A0ACA9YCJ9_9ASCO|nr:hypothetical protein CLIB1444_10S01508 [[Candida] jaroonii]
MSSSYNPGGQNVRVVSDLSRFEFESPTPKIRSRNPTPPSNNHSSQTESPQLLHKPSFHDEILSEPRPPFTGRQRSRTLIEIAESSTLPKARDNTYDYDDIYKYYEKQSNSSVADLSNAEGFYPYPSSLKDEPVPTNGFGLSTFPEQHSVGTPITNQTSIMNPHTSGTLTNNNYFNNNYKDKDLPPIMDTQQYYQFTNNVSDESVYKSNDTLSFSSKQQKTENHLVKSVMNRRLFSFRPGNIMNDEGFEGREIVITVNFLLYFFEMIVAIIIIILSSVLVREDMDIASGIYRYFIADSAISLIISILFMTTVVNFEKRNGSFYVTCACILSLVSFIITISTVIPSDACKTASICSTRKANSAFLIISFFLWLIDLVMFLTTLYISRLNLLTELNFDYSHKGLEKEFNKSLSDGSTVNFNQEHNDDLLDPRSGQPLRQYYLNEVGEMYELTDDFDVRGKNKIIVYTV